MIYEEFCARSRYQGQGQAFRITDPLRGEERNSLVTNVFTWLRPEKHNCDVLMVLFCFVHDDLIKWKHFLCYWPFVRGIHWSPVNSPHKGQWRGALIFFICAWINGWVNNREAGNLGRHRGHYDVIVMRLNKLLNKRSMCRWFVNTSVLSANISDTFQCCIHLAADGCHHNGIKCEIGQWPLHVRRPCHFSSVNLNQVIALSIEILIIN